MPFFENVREISGYAIPHPPSPGADSASRTRATHRILETSTPIVASGPIPHSGTMGRFGRFLHHFWDDAN